MISLSKLSALAATTVLLLLAGCKIHVLMPEGGEVQSVASGTCLTGSVCIHQVSDTTYTETFTAVPHVGWEFVKWNNGDEFLCGDSSNPVCVVSNVALSGNAAAEAVVDSNHAFYLLPVFVETVP